MELLVPADIGPGWIARVDDEGHPQMESGEFFVHESTPLDGRPALRWRESELDARETARTVYYDSSWASAARPAEAPVDRGE